MYRYLILILILFSASICAKEKDQTVKLKTLMSQADESIKNKKDLDKAEVNLVEALTRTDLTNKNRADIYYKLHMLRVRMLEEQNMKAYLKQPYDTTKFFSSILQIHKYLMQCDSVESIPNAKNKVIYKYRKKSKNILSSKFYRQNLYTGGRFLLRKSKYDEAYKYFDMYVVATQSDMMKKETRVQKDSIYYRAAFLSTVAGFSGEKWQDALKNIFVAIDGADSAKSVILHEYMVRCYDAMGERDTWVEALEDAVHCFPQHDYFYLHLIDHYKYAKQWDKGIALSDSLIRTFSDKDIYWLGKSQMMLGCERYEDCIECSNHAIMENDTLVGAYYNKGLSYLNLALKFAETACNDIDNPKCSQDRSALHNFYMMALDPMERVRVLAPDQQNLWAEPLYRIYMHLNMGEAFDEMENLLKGT